MSKRLDDQDWRELSEAASREKDPEELMELIRALNKALERREREQAPLRPVKCIAQMCGVESAA